MGTPRSASARREVVDGVGELGNQDVAKHRNEPAVMESFLRMLRYRIEYGAFRLIGALLSALPVEVASNLSGAAWRLVAPHLGRHQRALDHLALAYPDRTVAERDGIARQMWENLGRTFAEFFHLEDLAQGDRATFLDPAAADELRRDYSRGVVCSPHIGNWELVVIAATRIGLRPAGVYQRIKNPFVDTYVNGVRQRLYPGGLHVKGGDAAKRLIRFAKAGGTVALLADLRENRSISVPFFGHPARSTTFPAFVARTLGLPLFAGGAIRMAGCRFRLQIEEVPVPVTADRDADIAVATAALQACFEKLIRAHPEQWMWAHRRWG
jgi:KDO2-lipid IV(A) lauroyltransferase